MTDPRACVCGCGVELTGRQRKWASQDCYYTVAKERANKKYREEKFCVNDNKKLVGRQMRYCSLACKSEYQTAQYEALIASGQKRCVKCKQEVMLSDFYPHPNTVDRLRPECKLCTMDGNEERFARTGTRRAYHLKSLYNMSVEQYDTILDSQGGVCAICLRPPRGKKLSVDHDHITGIVRGLLCTSCNLRVVGKHRKGDVLRRAADYLDAPPAVNVIGEVVAPNRKKKRPARRRRR